MRAIILAAGKARRFGKYLAETPKCLLPLGDVPILLRQVSLLRSAGVNDIVIVKGHLADQIDIPGVRYYVNNDYAFTNMVISLFTARQELRGDVLITYGDILYDRGTLDQVLSADDCPIAVAIDVEWKRYYQARFGDPFFDAESLVMDSDGRIREIGGSRPHPAAVQGQYIGITRLNSLGASTFVSFFEDVTLTHSGQEWIRGRSVRNCYMTDFLQGLVLADVPVRAVSIHNGWIEFDTASDYERVLAWHAAGTLSTFCALVD